VIVDDLVGALLGLGGAVVVEDVTAESLGGAEAEGARLADGQLPVFGHRAQAVGDGPTSDVVVVEFGDDVRDGERGDAVVVGQVGMVSLGALTEFEGSSPYPVALADGHNRIYSRFVLVVRIYLRLPPRRRLSHISANVGGGVPVRTYLRTLAVGPQSHISANTEIERSSRTYLRTGVGPPDSEGWDFVG